jgi:lipoprotein-anchoring transpeptidase ErfK/SrfK
MLLRAGVLLVFVGVACAAAPSSSQMPAIAYGVKVGGVDVGGLTSEPARARVAVEYARSIRVVRGDRRWWASPRRLGADAAVDSAVAEALGAAPEATVGLEVRSSPAAVRSFARRVARAVDRDPVDARLVGLGRRGPRIEKEHWGVAVRRNALEAAITSALASGTRTPLQVPVRILRPSRTMERFGPLIVIWRGANTLRLYHGTKPVRSFRVATGTSQYPTPSGLFAVVDKQMHPWWRPPDSDWARELEPIPPGPENPLGTRWMGLSAPGVGIHGTPSPASIGYSASHGCIRMYVPEAEWLFTQVELGTPVLIV